MSSIEKPLVIGLGEVLWDMLPSGKQFGGAPANFAYHAKAMGAEGVVVSCVGDDELGREILKRLDALELGRECVAVDPKHPTGTVSVTLDADGKPDYVIHEPVAWDFIPTVSAMEELAARTDAVGFGSLAQREATSRATVQHFLGATRPDCLRIFDINLRQHYYDRDTIAAGLEAANVLKLNDEELPVVAELLAIEGDEEALLATLIERFSLHVIALTKGGDGSVLAAADERSVHPGFAVEATAGADTVGAGDSFTAVLAMGLLRGLDLDTINQRANRTACHVCGQSGATPEMPVELKELP